MDKLLDVQIFNNKMSAYYYDNFMTKKPNANKDQVYLHLTKLIPAKFDSEQYELANKYICKLIKF